MKSVYHAPGLNCKLCTRLVIMALLRGSGGFLNPPEVGYTRIFHLLSYELLCEATNNANKREDRNFT